MAYVPAPEPGDATITGTVMAVVSARATMDGMAHTARSKSLQRGHVLDLPMIRTLTVTVIVD